MQIPPEALGALISAFSVLLVFALRDVALQTTAERQAARRKLLQLRIEQAYAPLEFLIYRMLRTDDPRQREGYVRDIELILRRSSHLPSEQVTSALYTLLDDPEAGAALLQPHFFDEFDALKQQFYASWHVGRPPGNHGRLPPSRKGVQRAGR
jgi:hypothetical protein